MSLTASWHPILPAHGVHPGAPPLAARLQGTDLVVWRGAAGALQIWLARCPHRGVHLGLGRVLGERLACAYHGWEFEAGSGRCVAIPALADLADVPGQVQATPCGAQEWDGMVWVQLPGEAASDALAPAAAGVQRCDSRYFLRQLTLRATQAQLHAQLQRAGFEPLAPAVWQGVLAGHALRLFSCALQTDLACATAWLRQAPAQGHADAALAALRRLRADTENPAQAC